MANTPRTNGSVVYPSISRALAKLGSDISIARRIRNLAAEDFARSMGVSRATLHRLEKGEVGVSLHTLAAALNVLGRLGALADLVDQPTDDVGMAEVRRKLPRRVARSHAARRGEVAAVPGDEPQDVVEGW